MKAVSARDGKIFHKTCRLKVRLRFLRVNCTHENNKCPFQPDGTGVAADRLLAWVRRRILRAARGRGHPFCDGPAERQLRRPFHGEPL